MLLIDRLLDRLFPWKVIILVCLRADGIVREEWSSGIKMADRGRSLAPPACPETDRILSSQTWNPPMPTTNPKGTFEHFLLLPLLLLFCIISFSCRVQTIFFPLKTKEKHFLLASWQNICEIIQWFLKSFMSPDYWICSVLWSLLKSLGVKFVHQSWADIFSVYFGLQQILSWRKYTFC